MTAKAHAEAFLAKLRADVAAPALVVLDGQVVSEKPPYVLVYFDYDAPSAEQDSQSSDLTHASRRRNLRAYCHSVATTAAGARSVAARVEAALLDQTLTVPGRECFPVRHDGGQPARREELASGAVFDQVDTYLLASVPAS